MATHSSVLAWRIPGMGEPGGLPSMRLHRVEHDWSDLAAASGAVQESWVQSLGQEDPLEKEMANHSNILAWKIQWAEEPDGLQSMGCKESDITEQLTRSDDCFCLLSVESHIYYPNSMCIQGQPCRNFPNVSLYFRIHTWWTQAEAFYHPDITVTVRLVLCDTQPYDFLEGPLDLSFFFIIFIGI